MNFVSPSFHYLELCHRWDLEYYGITQIMDRYSRAIFTSLLMTAQRTIADGRSIPKQLLFCKTNVISTLGTR